MIITQHIFITEINTEFTECIKGENKYQAHERLLSPYPLRIDGSIV